MMQPPSSILSSFSSPLSSPRSAIIPLNWMGRTEEECGHSRRPLLPVTSLSCLSFPPCKRPFGCAVQWDGQRQRKKAGKKVYARSLLTFHLYKPLFEVLHTRRGRMLGGRSHAEDFCRFTGESGQTHQIISPLSLNTKNRNGHLTLCKISLCPDKPC